MTWNQAGQRPDVGRVTSVRLTAAGTLRRSAICLLVALTLAACGSSGGTASPAPSAAESTSAQDAISGPETAGVPQSEAAAGTGSGESAAADVPSSEELPSVEESTDGAGPGEEVQSDGSGTEADCPLSAADITAATSVQWEFREFQAARPLEGNEEILTTVCAFVAAEVVDQYGDPAFLRTDVFTGADAAARQVGFASTCTEFGGTVTPSSVSGGVTCVKDGVAVEAQVGDPDRTVEILINTSAEMAAQFSPAWDQILATVN